MPKIEMKAMIETMHDDKSAKKKHSNLDKAFQHFFVPKLPSRYPRFKRKHGRQSSYHCMSVDCGDNWIKVPKLKQPIKARIHRKVF